MLPDPNSGWGLRRAEGARLSREPPSRPLPPPGRQVAGQIRKGGVRGDDKMGILACYLGSRSVGQLSAAGERTVNG